MAISLTIRQKIIDFYKEEKKWPPSSPDANPMDFSAYLVHSGDEGLLEKLFIYQAFNQKTTRTEETLS